VSAYGRIDGCALMYALNAAPVLEVFVFGGGGAGIGGIAPPLPLANLAVQTQVVHAHLMWWVYIGIPVVFAFLFGWAFGAEHARSAEWWRRHRGY
jgi:hypothetical protein